MQSCTLYVVTYMDDGDFPQHRRDLAITNEQPGSANNRALFLEYSRKLLAGFTSCIESAG